MNYNCLYAQTRFVCSDDIFGEDESYILIVKYNGVIWGKLTLFTLLFSEQYTEKQNENTEKT